MRAREHKRLRALRWAIVMGLAAVSGIAAASEMPKKADAVVVGDGQVVVSRGGVDITLAEIDARVMELPAKLRAGYLDDPERLDQTVNGILLEKQLAQKAKEFGAENDPYLALQIAQAKDRFLAARARAMAEDQVTIPDFSALAEERYLADPSKFAAPDLLELTHVLIGTRGRTDAEAQALAQDVHRQAVAGTPFDELVAKYTDEQSRGQKSSGKLNKVARGMMVPEFEKVAFELREPGQISDVVKTQFGYHVIRLESRTDGSTPAFETVKPKIVAELTQQFVEKQKAAFVAEIRDQKLEADPAVVASLRTRYTAEGPKGARIAGAGAASAKDEPVAAAGR